MAKRTREKFGFDYLNIDDIDVSFSNVRKSNLEEGIDELANSIREIGIQQPVVVIKKGRRYELIIGQRRYLACQKAGETKIPALITTVKDKTDAIIKSFSENIHRLDLDYRDKMQVVLELLKAMKSIDKVAQYLGVNRQTVKNYLGYAAVPEEIKKMVDVGKLSVITAMNIVKNTPDEEFAVSIAREVKEIPRGKDRSLLMNAIKENPGKTADEVKRIARQRKNMRSITIHVTQRVYRATVAASRQYQNDAENIVKEALEEWLEKQGFIQ